VKIENERLPWELGWMKREEKVGLRDVLDVVEAIRGATGLLTGGATEKWSVEEGRNGNAALRSIHMP